MWVGYKGRQIKNRFLDMTTWGDSLGMLQELSQDDTVNKYASNLVYLTRSKEPQRIESRIIYSILRKKPKRADHYWFLNISLLNEPFGMRYTLETLVPDVAYKINFSLVSAFSRASTCCFAGCWRI